uniref:Uncharacterized protein n=1 Tax=Anopheles culicifacies TaxID=139723 RepID=A0A182MB37_9DIPT
MRFRFPLRRVHLGWILLLAGLFVATVADSELATVPRNGRPERGFDSANARFNEVLDRENLRTLINRQLPKQGRFFEEFDGRVIVLVGTVRGQGGPSPQQEQDILILDALGKRQTFNNEDYGQNSIIELLGRMIPQTCRHKGRKFECGLSLSCVLGGGKPLDLCSGGMIWSCCIDRDFAPESDPEHGAVHNATRCKAHVPFGPASLDLAHVRLRLYGAVWNCFVAN